MTPYFILTLGELLELHYSEKKICMLWVFRHWYSSYFIKAVIVLLELPALCKGILN